MSKWWQFGRQTKEERVNAILGDLLAKSLEGSAETLDVYRQLAEITTTDERTSFLLGFSKRIEDHDGFAWEILTAFILGDTEHKIISTAAMNLAVLQPCPDGEELAGVRTVFKLVERVGFDSPRSASMLSGLLLLGDVQLFPFLNQAWQELTPECRHIVASSWSGLTARATVLMLLDWLEREENESVYGALAGTLGRMALGAHDGKIVDIQRSFPAYAGEPINVLGVQDVRTFGRGIKDRLDALANKETGDRVMPMVLQAWLGDEDAEDLIQDKASPSARARAFVEGRVKPDLAGERFVDSRPYWLQDDPLTAHAQLFMLQKMSEAADSSEEYNPRVPWFSALRECVVLNLDRSSVEAWCSYAFLVGLHKQLLDEEDYPLDPDAAGIVSVITKMITGEQGVVAGTTPWFMQQVFIKMHETLNLDISEPSEEIAILGYSQKSFLLGQMAASQLTTEQKNLLLKALPKRRPHERIVYPVAHRTVTAQTTGELAISPFLRYCQIKYSGHPQELRFFASYFQEAEELANLSITSEVADWIADASEYVERVLAQSPAVRQQLLDEHRGEYGALLDMFRSIGEAFDGDADDPVEVTRFYWNHILKREEFGEDAGPCRFDQIVVGVDFIAWWHMLQGAGSPDFP
jgi:hypothetical protein